jgi:hypothetical protein
VHRGAIGPVAPGLGGPTPGGGVARRAVEAAGRRAVEATAARLAAGEALLMGVLMAARVTAVPAHGEQAPVATAVGQAAPVAPVARVALAPVAPGAGARPAVRRVAVVPAGRGRAVRAGAPPTRAVVVVVRWAAIAGVAQAAVALVPRARVGSVRLDLVAEAEPLRPDAAAPPKRVGGPITTMA